MRYFTIGALILSGLYPGESRAIDAVAGHSVFRSSGGSAYVELYWQVNPASLHYKKDSLGRISARLHTRIRISGNDSIIHKEEYYLQTKPFDPESAEASPILDQFSHEFPSGKAYVEVEVYEDNHPESTFKYQDSVSLQVTKEPFYSSLQLIDTAIATQPQTRSKDVTRAGTATVTPPERSPLIRLPRALNFYDDGERNLQVYGELYELAGIPINAFPLTQTLYISKNKADQVTAEVSVKTNITAAAIDSHRYFRHTLSLAPLTSGNYYLGVSLRTATGAELAKQSAFFQLVNKNPVAAVTDSSKDVLTSVDQIKGTYLDLSKTFAGKFDIAQLRAILKMMQPTADPTEASTISGFLERPDELYMRYFVYNHFLNVDKADPARAWKLFSDHIREINRMYKSGTAMGYETDRGIIRLRFGAPAEIIRVPNEAGAVPYEIWRYNVGGKIQGSGMFLFYSPGFMSSDFRLLHSTVPGERRNPDWRTQLYSTGVASGNMNSRAEEYIGKQ